MKPKTSALRRKTMQAVKSGNTKPELVVRRLIHGMGYRYRLHRKDLPGKPDIVFPGRRKVIFVHGCFWHQHDAPHCHKGIYPQSNQDYWIRKLGNNKRRDNENVRALEVQGWQVLIAWECEIKDIEQLTHKLKNFLGKR